MFDIPHNFEATENVCDIPNDEATEKVSVMSFKNDITNNFEATENKTNAPNTWLT